jgi:hypothetical protein
MKLLQIMALVLCLNVPMARAGGDVTLAETLMCPVSVGVSAGCTTATLVVAHDLYKRWNTLSPLQRKIELLSVAVVGLSTLYSASLTYTICTSNQ